MGRGASQGHLIPRGEADLRAAPEWKKDPISGRQAAAPPPAPHMASESTRPVNSPGWSRGVPVTCPGASASYPHYQQGHGPAPPRHLLAARRPGREAGGARAQGGAGGGGARGVGGGGARPRVPALRAPPHSPALGRRHLSRWLARGGPRGAWGGVGSPRPRRPRRLTKHTARATTCGCARKRRRSKEPPALAAP